MRKRIGDANMTAGSPCGPGSRWTTAGGARARGLSCGVKRIKPGTARSLSTARA
jgi:hypothetical protein